MPPLRRLISMAYEVHAPVVSRTDDEVDGEAADHAFASETFADHLCLGADRRRVREVGGEAAAEVALSARPAEHLVVGRQQLDVARRCDPQLHAGAAELDAGDAFLDDAAAARRACRGMSSSGVSGRSNCICAQACDDPGCARRGSPGAGRPRRSTSALPSPETPSLSLTMTLGHRAAARLIATTASATSSRCAGSRARADGGHPPRRTAAGIRSWCRGATSRGSAPYIGIPRATAMSRSSSVVL